MFLSYIIKQRQTNKNKKTQYRILDRIKRCVKTMGWREGGLYAHTQKVSGRTHKKPVVIVTWGNGPGVFTFSLLYWLNFLS